MAWPVSFTDQFEAWWDELDEREQEALSARVELLEQFGPSLGRPSVDHIEGSRHQNMKELRVSEEGVLRVLFVFDPEREAVLLLGGDKRGDWEHWYVEMVPRADDLYDELLAELQGKGRS